MRVQAVAIEGHHKTLQVGSFMDGGRLTVLREVRIDMGGRRKGSTMRLVNRGMSAKAR